MRIAILLYDRLTALDAIGPYEVLAQLPDTEIVFVAERTGPIRNEAGSLAITADATLDELPNPDLLLVPGGIGQVDHMTGSPILDWLRAADHTTTWTTSVCTGALLLAAAGLLTGRRATTHWLALDQLRHWGAIPTSERVVTDDKYVTAAGVSAGIDMALTLAARIAGDHTAQAIQLGIEYDPQPPFQTGSPATAPEPLVAALRARSRFILTGQA